MATSPASAKLASTTACSCLLRNCNGSNGLNCNQHSSSTLLLRNFSPPLSRRSLSISCKMRPRNSNYQQKKQQLKKGTTEPPPASADVVQNDREDNESESTSTSEVSSLNQETIRHDDTKADAPLGHMGDGDFSSLMVSDKTNLLAVDKDSGDQLSNVQLEDIIAMIKNAEKNVLLLNQARVRALEDLEKILSEKESLQGEINTLEMRLAETNARIKVATQEKIHVELLEDELQKLRNELCQNDNEERTMLNCNEDNTKFLDEEKEVLQSSKSYILSEELSQLREENFSLQNDIQALKTRLGNVKNTDERVIVLEKERSALESAFRDLELKLSESQEEVSKLSVLKSECKDLWEKVENLQALLNKATKQADHAIIVIQQNQDLRKKVEKLEESLEEANVYKLSSEKMQEYSDLMQRKIKLMEDRLQRSDDEIHSYVQLYQESVQEFQETLTTLKEESKKRALDEPVNDMPWEFWSQLLLTIDGWLLEKKIPSNDAHLLREMVWKRNARLCDAYITSKDKTESEILAALQQLTFSSER